MQARSEAHKKAAAFQAVAENNSTYFWKMAREDLIEQLAYKNDQGLTPIAQAASIQSWTVVKEIVCQSKRLDSKLYNFGFGYALINAAEQSAFDAMKSLLECKISPNIKSSISQDTCLHYAVQNSNADTIKLLFKYGAHAHLKNNNDKTPMQLALEKIGNHFPDWSIVQVLAESANIHAEQLEEASFNEALEQACIKLAPLNVIEALLKAGASPTRIIQYNARWNGMTLLQVAASGHDYITDRNNLVALLLNYGADPYQKNVAGEDSFNAMKSGHPLCLSIRNHRNYGLKENANVIEEKAALILNRLRAHYYSSDYLALVSLQLLQYHRIILERLADNFKDNKDFQYDGMTKLINRLRHDPKAFPTSNEIDVINFAHPNASTLQICIKIRNVLLQYAARFEKVLLGFKEKIDQHQWQSSLFGFATARLPHTLSVLKNWLKDFKPDANPEYVLLGLEGIPRILMNLQTNASRYAETQAFYDEMLDACKKMEKDALQMEIVDSIESAPPFTPVVTNATIAAELPPSYQDHLMTNAGNHSNLYPNNYSPCIFKPVTPSAVPNAHYYVVSQNATHENAKNPIQLESKIVEDAFDKLMGLPAVPKHEIERFNDTPKVALKF